jgi:undecaprenyl-diphosphatase
MGWLGTIDQDVFRWFQDHQTPALNAAMVNLTDLGQRTVVTAVGVLAALCFLSLRRCRLALVIVLATFGSWGLVDAVKWAVQRPRPAGAHWLEPSVLSRALGRAEDHHGGLPQTAPAEKGYSFPSSHALSSTATYLTVALLTMRRLRRRWLGKLVIAATSLLVLVIGVTRLYVGAHYVSDVVAGWAGGLGVALVCAWLDEKWAAPHEARLPAESGPPAPV